MTSTTAQRALADATVDAWAHTLRALADPVRLRIVSMVATSPAGQVGAGEIADGCAVTGPTVSHHLRVLRDAGVLTSQRRGTAVLYRLAPGTEHVVPALLAALAAVEATPGPDGASRQQAGAGTGAGGGTGGRPGLDASVERAIVERLAREHPDVPATTTLLTVRESAAALLRTSTGTPAGASDLADRTERFAGQRLTDLADVAGGAGTRRRPHVLFVCVANAGRSQLAAALLARHAGDRVVVRSAGSLPAPAVHGVVEPLLAEILGPGAEAPFPKPLTDDAVRAADVVVTMGCGDVCPVLPGTRYEDWAVGDPAMASPAGARMICDDIDRRVRALAADLLPSPLLPADLLPARSLPTEG